MGGYILQKLRAAAAGDGVVLSGLRGAGFRRQRYDAG